MDKKRTFAILLKLRMKNFIALLAVVLILTSCGPYQKALKSTDPEVKLGVIDTLLSQEKYSKAVNLFEQIVPVYRGTEKAEGLAIKYAKALYETRDFPNSAYQYERFVNSHPKSEDREYALFMAAKSHYEMSNVYSRDQRDTQRAMAKVQDYIDIYPSGKYVVEGNAMVSELRLKLDRKAYEIAKNYHHREKYIPALATFENFIADHPGSEYLDDAQFYMLDSQYSYAIKSTAELVPERLEKAKELYNTFVRRYPDSQYIKDAEKIKEKIDDFKFEELQIN